MTLRHFYWCDILICVINKWWKGHFKVSQASGLPCGQYVVSGTSCNCSFHQTARITSRLTNCSPGEKTKGHRQRSGRGYNEAADIRDDTHWSCLLIYHPKGRRIKTVAIEVWSWWRQWHYHTHMVPGIVNMEMCWGRGGKDLCVQQQ